MTDSTTSSEEPVSATSTYVRPWWNWSYIVDYALVLLLGVGVAVVHFAAPYRVRFLPTADPSFTYPLTEFETVPAWLLMVLAVPLPIAVNLVVLLVRHLAAVRSGLANKLYSRRRLLHEAHHFLLAFLMAFLLNLLATDAIKYSVGRYRPDWDARAGDGRQETEGHLSFVSGHSSISFCSMTFLSLWLAGNLRLFCSAHLWKLLVALLPEVLATFIALSRLIDYRHHFSDVIGGSLMGVAIAVVAYFMFFGALNSIKTSGVPKKRPRACFGEDRADEKGT